MLNTPKTWNSHWKRAFSIWGDCKKEATCEASDATKSSKSVVLYARSACTPFVMQIACKTNWPRRPKVWNISRKRTAQGCPKRQPKKHRGDLEGPKTWNIHRKHDFSRMFNKFSKSRQAESVKHSPKPATTTIVLDLPVHGFTIGILQFWRKSCQKRRTVVKNGGGSRSGGSTIIFIKKQ